MEEMEVVNGYQFEQQRAISRTNTTARLALILIFVAVGVVAFWLVSAL